MVQPDRQPLYLDPGNGFATRPKCTRNEIFFDRSERTERFPRSSSTNSCRSSDVECCPLLQPSARRRTVVERIEGQRGSGIDQTPQSRSRGILSARYKLHVTSYKRQATSDK